MSALRSRLLGGLAVATSLVVVVALGLTLLGVGEASDEDTTVRTTLVDAGALEEGNEVRVAGVRLGEISEIQLNGKQADVTLKVDEAVLPLHDDASLSVKPVNLLGENYIDLDPGSEDAPYLDTAVIPTERTEVAVTLQDVLGTFQAPTAASLAAVVTTLGEGLEGNGANLAETLKKLVPAMEQTEQLGDVLAGQNQQLNDLIEALDPVAAALADDEGQTLDNLVESARDTLAAVTAQQKALRRTLAQLPGTLVSARATLTEFGGVADEAVPTLRALRPLTGDLSQVVDELEDFADSADPALASLEPVLDQADELLEQAAPVVAGLRQAGPDLRGAASSLRPLSREVLDNNLQGVMDFVRKWALSTNGRDSLSHYFRGVVYVTPDSLESIANSLVPSGPDVDGDGDPEVDLPDLPDVQLPDINLPDLPQLPDLDLPGTLGGLPGGGGNGGLLGRSARGAAASSDPTSALGLTTQQESALLSQLFGGDQ